MEAWSTTSPTPRTVLNKVAHSTPPMACKLTVSSEDTHINTPTPTTSSHVSSSIQSSMIPRESTASKTLLRVSALSTKISRQGCSSISSLSVKNTAPLLARPLASLMPTWLLANLKSNEAYNMQSKHLICEKYHGLN